MPRDIESLPPEERDALERGTRVYIGADWSRDSVNVRQAYAAGWLAAHNWLRNELRAAVARAERNHAAG